MDAPQRGLPRDRAASGGLRAELWSVLADPYILTAVNRSIPALSRYFTERICDFVRIASERDDARQKACIAILTPPSPRVRATLAGGGANFEFSC